MEMNKYQAGAAATCMKESDNYVYMSNGLTEEVGELLGKVSKAVRKGKMVVRDNELMFTDSALLDERQEVTENLKKELGDVLWMVSGMARVLGFSLEEVAACNLAKLADRKVRGVIVGEGDNR